MLSKWKCTCNGMRRLLLGALISLVPLSAQTVTITNTTRGGSDYFEVGDGVQVNVTGSPGASVTYTYVQNGTSGGPVTAGTTSNPGGTYQFNGTMTSALVGSWTETWYVGGVQATPTLYFAVGPPSVSILNTTRGGSTYFDVNDGFQLTISGGIPNAAVTVTYTQNNAGGGPASMGDADGNGSRVISGTETSPATGTWAQTWFVGGVQATPTLSFSVTPGCQVGLLNYPGNPPRFFFDTTYWYYAGMMSTTGIVAAANAWNNDSSGTGITLANDPTDSMTTVYIYDDSTIAPLLGQEVSYNFQNGYAACYDHPSVSCSGLCANASKMYTAGIQLNPGGIATTASNWGISTDTALQETASHELGHAFGLADYTGPLDCANPTVMSQTGGQDYQCLLYTPQTCDTNRVNSFFSGWTIWSWSACGPTCNLNLNCN